MKKIIQSWRKEYKPLKLFKEDIEEIVKIATTDSSQDSSTKGGTDIGIRIDEFELDSIKELSEINKDITNELYIAAACASLQLTLGRESARLYISDKENTRLMGMASRIDEILRNRQRTFGFVYEYPFWSGCLIGMPTPIFLFLAWISGKPLFVSLLTANLVIAVWGGLYVLYIDSHFSTIHMSYSYDKPSFFKRNKDTILVSLIASIVTFILGILSVLLVQWIAKNR